MIAPNSARELWCECVRACVGVYCTLHECACACVLMYTTEAPPLLHNHYSCKHQAKLSFFIPRCLSDKWAVGMNTMATPETRTTQLLPILTPWTRYEPKARSKVYAHSYKQCVGVSLFTKRELIKHSKLSHLLRRSVCFQNRQIVVVYITSINHLNYFKITQFGLKQQQKD